jgi:hypothetical protein
MNSKYPYTFSVERDGLMYVVMACVGSTKYRASQRFWLERTALRVADDLTQWFRTGVDYGIDWSKP